MSLGVDVDQPSVDGSGNGEVDELGPGLMWTSLGPGGRSGADIRLGLIHIWLSGGDAAGCCRGGLASGS